MCKKPLRLLDTVIEHVVPKSLGKARLAAVKLECGLPDTFDVLGFDNLLPSCAPCNLTKSNCLFSPSPQIQLVLQRTAAKANTVRLTAQAVRKNVAIDRVLQAVFMALEERAISMNDLDAFLADITRAPAQAGVPDDVIILSDGYWYRRSKIVAEGLCRCEREACVGANAKVYCYFHDELPAWVVATGLYHQCYDEIIFCTICKGLHKRGHIGSPRSCGARGPAGSTTL